MTLPKRIFAVALIAISVMACSTEPNANFTLKGKIKGLKKGTVYLQREGDSTIIDLDSVVISGQPNFELHTELTEPVLLYLKLNKNDGQEHFIPFFADKGITELETSLKNYNYDVVIKGSEQQKLLDDYTEMMSKFNNQNLDLIEANFLAQKDNDKQAADSILNVSNRLFKRKYSYTIQFAMNNNDSELSPYLALYELPNANAIYIDSIYNNLTDKVKQSSYGKKLNRQLSK